MHCIIKNLPLLFCLFAPPLLAADTPVTIRVRSVSFNYLEFKDRYRASPVVVKGTTLEFAIVAAEHYGVEDSPRIWSISSDKEGVNVSVQGINGSHLGGLKYTDHDMGVSSRTKRLEAYYYLTFSNLPANGTDELNLSGKLPVWLLSNQTTSPPQPLQIAKGAELFLGDLTTKVDIPKQKKGRQFKVDFRFSSPNKAMRIISMDFFNLEGKPLVNDKGRPSFLGGGSGFTIASNRTEAHMEYLFEQKPDLLNVSLKYWAEAEEKEFPVPTKVFFYDPDGDKIDEKQQ